MIKTIAKIKFETSSLQEIEFEVDRHNILSLETDLQSKITANLPSYGLISNGASISFKDSILVEMVGENGETYKTPKEGVLIGYAINGDLNENVSVQFVLVNTITKKEEVFGTYKKGTWDYNTDKMQVSLSLKDGLEDWQEIQMSAISFDPEFGEQQTFGEIYTQLVKNAQIQNVNIIAEFNELDEDTKNHLNKLICARPNIKSGTLWEQFEKFCVATQCRMYINENGIAMPHYHKGA